MWWEIWARPALSWVVMLNMTKFELELSSDADIIFFIVFKKGMRERVSYIYRG